MGQFVDQGHGGMAGDDRVRVHLFHGHAAVLDAAARNDFQPVEQGRGVAPAVSLHETHHHVRTAVVAAVPFFEHLVGLADARGHAHVDAESGALRFPLGRQAGEHLIAGWAEGVRRLSGHCSSPSRSRLSSRTWTLAAPRKPRNGWLVWRATTVRT